MPVFSVNGLKNAASSAAVQLPPHVLTLSVLSCAAARRAATGASAAAAAVVFRNVLRFMVSPPRSRAFDAACRAGPGAFYSRARPPSLVPVAVGGFHHRHGADELVELGERHVSVVE